MQLNVLLGLLFCCYPVNLVIYHVGLVALSITLDHTQTVASEDE